MPHSLKGKVLLSKSYRQDTTKDKVPSVLASVNRALDNLIQMDEKQRTEQHIMISEAIAFLDRVGIIKIIQRNLEDDAKMEPQNVLSGAIIIGNLPLVKSLLSEDSTVLPNVNTESLYFGRPLQLAAAWDRLEIVRYLLDCGADPYANTDPYIKADDIYLESSRQLGFRDRHVYRSPVGSALRVAVLGGHEEIVRLLLKPAYRLSHSTTEYFQAILAGARGGHIHLINLLLQFTGKAISDFEELGGEMLWEAARHNQEAVVQMLLDSGIDVNAAQHMCRLLPGCALSTAAAQGNVRMVRRLLDRGADVNLQTTKHGSPIEAAARGGHEDVVEILLEYGASPGAAFVCAADAGQWRLVRWLLERGVNFLEHDPIYGGIVGMDALQRSIIAKSPTVIAMLVGAGVPLDESCNFPSELPILIAKRVSAEWIVELLLALGAKDREFDIDRQAENYSEDCYDAQMERGGVKITKRTWEWMGKY